MMPIVQCTSYPAEYSKQLHLYQLKHQDTIYYNSTTYMILK